MALLCHEALRLDKGARRATFECWATNEHARPLDWAALKPDPPGPLPAVDHDTPLAAVVGGAALVVAGVVRGSWRMANRIVLRQLRR